jgi:hypothetical protein
MIIKKAYRSKPQKFDLLKTNTGLPLQARMMKVYMNIVSHNPRQNYYLSAEHQKKYAC